MIIYPKSKRWWWGLLEDDIFSIPLDYYSFFDYLKLTKMDE